MTDIETVISVQPIGQLANRMIQHMAALSLAARVPGARISRIHLPEWRLEEPEFADLPAPIEHLSGNNLHLNEVAVRLQLGTTRTVQIIGYAQNMRNLLPPDIYRRHFVSDLVVSGFGPDELLISMRTAEVLSADYPPYVLLPISFYRQIIAETGLKPVFFGQLSDCQYLDDLKAAFPEARFVHGGGVINDFETIRRSRNILLSVSTFAWCAAWLSEADQIIMPLTGLFNPVFAEVSCGQLDLMPRHDRRYRFFLFPINVAVKADRLAQAHMALDGRWREIKVEEVDAIFERRSALKPSLHAHLALFDEEFYLRVHSEISRLVSEGVYASGRAHYMYHGFSERRRPFWVDPTYLYRYPDAALAVSDGHYLDLCHFHAERGVTLGYSADDARAS